MRDAEVRDIAGRTFEVTPLPAGKGFALMLRIGKLLGPLAGLVGDTRATMEAAGPIVAEVLERATEEDIAGLYRPLAECTVVHIQGPGGETRKPKLSEVFDVTFAGDYPALFQWLVFALEVNFGPFMRWLQALPRGSVAGPVAVAKG